MTDLSRDAMIMLREIVREQVLTVRGISTYCDERGSRIFHHNTIVRTVRELERSGHVVIDYYYDDERMDPKFVYSTEKGRNAIKMEPA